MVFFKGFGFMASNSDNDSIIGLFSTRSSQKKAPDRGTTLPAGTGTMTSRPPAPSRATMSSSAATLNTVSRASSELDIRGYETLEAESVVENYLDSAVMAKLGTVTIIHGKGTGALRKAVHEILKRNKAVKSFRLGRYGEGEAGVTVVTLK